MPRRLGSAAQAVACIESGQTVGLMAACGEPQTLVEALVARASVLRRVRVFTGWHGVSAAPYAAPQWRDAFIPVTTQPGSATIQAVADGRGEYLPLSLGQLAKAIRDGEVRIDVAMVQVSPPFDDGLCSLGVAVDYARAMLDAAAVRIAEVNDQMPALGGQALVPYESFDYTVAVDRPLLELPVPATAPEAEAIGAAAAALVPGGATVQVGIGAIPSAVLAAFRDHEDLGVHSGLMSDGLLDLVDSGAVTGMHKTLDPGRVVACSAIGSRDLFDRLPGCDALDMRPATYTHDVATVQQQDRFVAINSAVEVDLAGNVNAEMVAGRRIAGPGGQPDFTAAAAQAQDGQSIICLPATAKGGRVSRIVAWLAEGTPVTTPGAHVTAVVTEYGAADLRGLDARARANALAGIAHPDFRAELLRAAAEG